MARRRQDLPPLPRTADLLPDMIDLVGEYQPSDRDMQIILGGLHGFAVDELEIALEPGTNLRFMSRHSAASSWLARNGLIQMTTNRRWTLSPEGLEYYQRKRHFDTASMEIDPKVKGRNQRAEAPPQPVSDERPENPPREPTKDEARQEKAHRAALKTIQSLPGMPLSKVYSVWSNAKKVEAESDDPHMVKAARSVMMAIAAERRRRGPVDGMVDDRFTFRWPTTDLTAATPESDRRSSSEGVFANVGYHVGRTRGASEVVRRQILADIYDGTALKALATQLEPRTWGNDRSARRLRLMANTIARLTKSAKRRDPMSLSVAISEWEEDLEWLRLAYYEGRYDFPWPHSDDTGGSQHAQY